MLPRFLKTFLIASLLIILPTLVILYQKHSAGSEWNEWSLGSGTWNGGNRDLPSDIDRDRSPLYLEEHWNAGGAIPKYQSTPIDAEQEKTANHGTVYRLGDTLVDVKELDDFKRWKETAGRPDEAQQKEDKAVSSFWVDDTAVHGTVIMPKLGNATAKAELGRAAWKLLHLITLRFPEEPTPDERAALKSYFHLFSRLYPCGECASEFQALLQEYPPQTSSRKTASLWLCSVHNLVNVRLGKPEFDCLTLDSTYDCGCAEDGQDTAVREDQYTSRATPPA